MNGTCILILREEKACFFLITNGQNTGLYKYTHKEKVDADIHYYVNSHIEELAPVDVVLGTNSEYEGGKIWTNGYGGEITLSYRTMKNISFTAPNYVNPYIWSSMGCSAAEDKFT